MPSRLAEARKWIILHAAVYANFAKSSRYSLALRRVLAEQKLGRLDIIRSPYSPEIARLIRYGRPESEVRKEFQESDAFLASLKEDFPGIIRIHDCAELPALPVIVVDDSLYFGQYARCPIFAPDGYWFENQADIFELFSWSKSGEIPDNATPEQLAVFRIVYECAGIISKSKGEFGEPYENNE